VIDKVLVGEYLSVCHNLPDNYFDLVICNDVIEHMLDERVFFESIKSKIANDASIVGSLPNVRFVNNLYELMVQKDWRDAGILDRTHLRFFTKKSICRTLDQCGFELCDMRGVNKMYNLDKPRGNTRRIKRLLQGTVSNICSLTLGRDTVYLQYGFRVKVKSSD